MHSVLCLYLLTKLFPQNSFLSFLGDVVLKIRLKFIIIASEILDQYGSALLLKRHSSNVHIKIE